MSCILLDLIPTLGTFIVHSLTLIYTSQLQTIEVLKSTIAALYFAVLLYSGPFGLVFYLTMLLHPGLGLSVYPFSLILLLQEV